MTKELEILTRTAELASRSVVDEESRLVRLSFSSEEPVTGATYWSGDAIITSISYSASFDGIVEATFSFTGTGALTESTVS